LFFAEFAAHKGIESIGIACLLHVHSRTSSSCSTAARNFCIMRQ
jgi:hypothetical protein